MIATIYLSSSHSGHTTSILDTIVIKVSRKNNGFRRVLLFNRTKPGEGRKIPIWEGKRIVYLKIAKGENNYVQ